MTSQTTAGRRARRVVRVGCACVIAGGLAVPLSWAAPVRVRGQASATVSAVTGGDHNRYREDQQLPRGFVGGLDWLTVDAGDQDQDWRLHSRIRAHNDDDLAMTSRLEGRGWYLTQDASMYPHYYDSSGRFYNTPPRRYELESGVRTLRGNVAVEAGTAVEHWPAMVVGWRHRVRSGETNSYWGAWLRNASPDDFILFVQPLARERDEQSNTLYVGATHQMSGWTLGARQEITRFEGVDVYDEPGYYNNGTYIFTRYYRNQPRHTTWRTMLNGARDAVDGRVHFTTNYQYAMTQTDSTTDEDSIASGGGRHYGEHSLNYTVSEHAGRQYNQTFGAKVHVTPWDWVRLWAGGQFLTGRSVGTSTRGEEGAEGAAVDSNDATVDELWANKAVNREVGWTEEAGIEVTAVPKTRLAFDLTLDQSRVKYDWTSNVSGSANSGNEGDWSWLSTIWEQRNSFTASARTWALPHVTVWGRYRYRVDNADVDDDVDVANSKPGDPEYTETTTSYYYPGRIEDTRRDRHEFLIATTFKMGPRLSISPRFENQNAHYRVSNEPVPEISSFRSNTFAVGLLTQPVHGLTCSLDLSRRFALTSTRASAFTNTLQSPNATWFGGLTPHFNASSTALNGEVQYALRSVTTFSNGEFVRGNGDFSTVLAVGGIGLRGQVKGIDGSQWETAYRYYDYHETQNGGINDYTAHGIFLVVRMPFEFGGKP